MELVQVRTYWWSNPWETDYSLVSAAIYHDFSATFCFWVFVLIVTSNVLWVFDFSTFFFTCLWFLHLLARNITNLMNALDQRQTDNDHDGHHQVAKQKTLFCVVLYHNTLHSLRCHFVCYKIILGFIWTSQWSTDKKRLHLYAYYNPCLCFIGNMVGNFGGNNIRGVLGGFVANPRE